MSTALIYPRISDLLPLERIPDGLEGIREALQDVFDDLYAKDLFVYVSSDGTYGHYKMKVVCFQEIGLNLPFIGGDDSMKLVINPTIAGTTEIPFSMDYNWRIIKYINQFNLDSFDNSLFTLCQILFDLAEVNPQTFLRKVIVSFIPEINRVELFINKINSDYGQTIVYDENIPVDQQLDTVLNTLENADLDLIQVIVESYVEGDGFSEGLKRLKNLFLDIIENVEENIKELIKLHFQVSLRDLTIGLRFPRKWLVPVNNGEDPNLEIDEPLPEPFHSYLTFNVGSLNYSIDSGLKFYKENSFSLNRSMIGNTGIIAEFHDLKIDLSSESNIPEATADGRPDTFKGAYARYAAITLPKKWFKNIAEDGQTLQIAGHNMLIGTGGISGTIALEALETGNDPGENDYFEVLLGKDAEKAWKLGFNKFDIRFNQGAVVESNIKARLEIPKFKRPDGQPGPLLIDVEGHLNEVGDFALTASVEGGIQASLFDFVTFNFLTLEVGSQDDDFFIGTSCEVWFENEFMQKILGDQKIQIPKIRVYTDGSIEFVGGNSFIPTNLTLNLGPINVAVTGVHFGSQEYNGRLYNYWGFDGAISLNPLGIDARGEGMKYFYPADGEGDPFFRIQTIEVDLVIPGTATPESALAIIHGMLSIPEPGDSPEYYGEIDIELPQVKVSGGAAMRLQPKHPAFIIDAYVDLPAPIPIGPVGIYGFRGLLGFKYIAEKEAIGMTSGEDSWYDYYVYPPKGIHVSKFSGPERSKDYEPAFSLGVGATLGTSFDNGMVVSLRAMLLFSFPTAFILDAGLTIISKRLGLIEEDPRNPPFFAFIALGDDSLEFGIGADFQLPDNGWILDLQARIEAGFFFKNQRPWYVNFGTRETPITATLFKDIINLSVWAYLMISGKGIEAGARAQLILDKNFFGIQVYLNAYIEVGGYVSFKRPQTGGYMLAGGAIKVSFWKVAGFEISLDTVFSLEAIKPFLLYAALDLKVCIKIVFEICIPLRVELKWEKSKEVDRTPYAPIPYNNSDEFQQNRTEELVKGVHMLTNETFDVKLLYTNPSTAPNEHAVNDGFTNRVFPVIPIDTYIDIKTVKGLNPSAVSISGLIGGHTGGADNFIDMIPPHKVVRGKELRQVTHKYSIEKIEIKAWNGSNWQKYNPFKALADEGTDISNLRIGYWQRGGKQYDTLRILATTPFSYISSGQPGWFIPEQYGISGAELFCEEEALQLECSDFLSEEVGNQYQIPTGYEAHYIDGVYYVIEGGNNIIVDMETGESYPERTDYFEITNALNPHSIPQSLSFKNSNKLLIILPTPSVSVKLTLSTEARDVKIYYYRSDNPENSSQTQHELIGNPITYTASSLANPIEFISEEQLISRIVIEPRNNDIDAINDVMEQIADLLNTGYEDENGEIQLPPYNQQEYEDLLEELRNLQSSGCSGNNNLPQSDKTLICQYYDDFLSRYWNCFIVPIDYTNSIPLIYIRQAQFVRDKLPCYHTVLSEMETFISQLSMSGYFTQYIVDYEIKLDALQTVCDQVMQDQNISYPVEVNQVLNAHAELLNVFKRYLNELESLKECTKITRICQKVTEWEQSLTSCLVNSLTFVNCYSNLRSSIDSFFEEDDPIRDILKYLLDEQQRLFANHNSSLLGPDLLRNLFKQNALNLFDTLRDIANCNAPDIAIDGNCSTSVQKVCWMTWERHQYNQTIPGQSAIEADQEDMEEGITKVVQPIWRPNTKYYLHFQLKDSVDNGEREGVYNYYYGFRTVGPVGYYHSDPESGYIPQGEKAESYALSSLRSYIDYKRSYPNADSSLLKSKPLFWGNEECKIGLYFSHPYVYHMFNSWKEYQDDENISRKLSEILGSINIVIKDPVTGIVVPYPLPSGYEESTVPIPHPNGDEEGSFWTGDDDPRLPLDIQTLIQYVENINASGDAIQCKLILGEGLIPKAYAYSVFLTNLKPQKLYTAIVYNAFDLNGNGIIDTEPQPQGQEYKNENQQVHEFVFQTSRYESFEDQVLSYKLVSDENENEQIQAVYEIPLELTQSQIDQAFDILYNSVLDETLEVQYLDYFDRITEGIFGMIPLDPPSHTEFNKIMDSATDKIIAILIRNPEPFNDPKIPLSEISNMISIEGELDNFKILYNRDYSQALIMHSSKEINLIELNFIFRYYTWNGVEYELISAVEANNINISLNP